MRKHLLAWMGWVCLALSGCAACPPMKAGWYLLDPAGNPELMVALVNEGDLTTLTRASVNPTKADGTGKWNFDFEEEMQPGRILLLNATHKGLPPCVVPVRIALRCAKSSEPSWISVSGSLPNYVPEKWLDSDHCMKLTGSAS